MFHTYVYVQFSSPKNAIMELKWSLTCQKVVWLFEAKTKCVSSICVLLSLSCLDLMDDLLWEEEEEKFCTPFSSSFHYYHHIWCMQLCTAIYYIYFNIYGLNQVQVIFKKSLRTSTNNQQQSSKDDESKSSNVSPANIVFLKTLNSYLFQRCEIFHMNAIVPHSNNLCMI